MEYVLCCLCSVLCFWCGVLAANGLRMPHRRRKTDTDKADGMSGDDALSRDIAAMLAYTIPGREKTDETE